MRFLSEDFMITGGSARYLYHEHAKKMPIIDYHCHIDPREIVEDRRYDTITQAWLAEDHYKWTAMRSAGVEEAFITGDADDDQKFRVYAEILPLCAGNPLYHWSHMELLKYFDYPGQLNADTAGEVWNLCNRRLPELSVHKMLEMSNVEVICTTDDPADSLEWHEKIRNGPLVVPAFRPDALFAVESGSFSQYVERLSQAAGVSITGLSSLELALQERIEEFHRLGCRLSDHAFLEPPWKQGNDREAAEALEGALAGRAVGKAAAGAYRTWLMCFLASQYRERNWVMQLHLGVARDINSTLYRDLGPDAGGDIISGVNCVLPLSGLMNLLEEKGILPKTIVYSINPADNAALDSLIGCFQRGPEKGRIQHGSAWWFNDTRHGILSHLTDLAAQSVLGVFIGMLTDSRSFLSYPRHDYFRRILCSFLGDMIDRREYPADYRRAGEMIENICYYNAKHYFSFGE